MACEGKAGDERGKAPSIRSCVASGSVTSGVAAPFLHETKHNVVRVQLWLQTQPCRVSIYQGYKLRLFLHIYILD